MPFSEARKRKNFFSAIRRSSRVLESHTFRFHPTTLHLLLQDPVLLDQVCDDFLLVAVHPA